MRLACTYEPSVYTGTCTEGSAIADTYYYWDVPRAQVLLHAPSALQYMCSVCMRLGSWAIHPWDYQEAWKRWNLTRSVAGRP